MKLKITVEIELPSVYTLDEDCRLWLENDILIGDGNLTLHSYEIGDIVGTVTKVVDKQWLDEASE